MICCIRLVEIEEFDDVDPLLPLLVVFFLSASTIMKTIIFLVAKLSQVVDQLFCS